MLSLMLFFSLGCFTESGPCDDYCAYVCDCHGGEEGYDCEECTTVYASADAALQDECETQLLDLQEADEAAGHTCDGADTGPVATE